ncbi:MAG: hypothetical protein Unbinned4234contig1003_29 [Prokaryotic dsDNA virus sp.]|nr:MAG: hypothetical protein Unbinned4234contig1003_29 [Prokaryotic dsDNA virus sp.]|tara:strand:+ start:1170 stop:1628 length:459 start_codon:yes stop_codon:yes gene_type:complete
MSNSKPQRALQLGINVLIDESCEGKNCRYHKFPYEISNLLLGKKDEKTLFNNTQDIWDFIKLLQEELYKHQEKASFFTILDNIWDQVPFFACTSHLISNESQKDISRFVYSKDTNTPPYSGTYGDTPHIWIQKYYIIKQSMSLKEKLFKQKA